MQYQTMQNLSPAGRHRLLALSRTVAEAMKSFVPDADSLEEKSDDTVIIQLHIQRNLHKALKLEASKYTNPKSGRQMGLYNYINRVLENHIRVAATSPMHRKDDAKFFGANLVPTPTEAGKLAPETTEVEAPRSPQRRLKPIG